MCIENDPRQRRDHRSGTSGRHVAPLIALAAWFSIGADCQLGGIQQLTLTPNPGNNLAAVIAFETSVAVTPKVTVIGPDGSWVVPSSGILSTAPGTAHEVMVLGLKAEAHYAFTVADADHRLVPDSSLTYDSGPLPADFPEIEIRVSHPEARNPGFVLVVDNDVASLKSWLIVLDEQGAPRWYWSDDVTVNEGTTGIRRLANGEIALLTYDWTRVRFVDPLGRVRELVAKDIGLDNVHHDLARMPGGHLLTVSTELRAISGFPGEPGPLNIAGDVLSELTPAGDIVRQWRLLDILDPHRLPFPQDSHFWDRAYPGVTGIKDWGHSNGLFHDDSDDGLVVSSLNQQLLFEIDAKTSKLRWVIGGNDPDTSGDDAWPFLARVGSGKTSTRHHSAQVVDGRYLFTYDNGNGPGGSRGWGVDLNPAARTYSEVFSWKDPAYDPPVTTPIGGDCDALANGNVLVFDATARFDGQGGQRLTEVRSSDGAKVFEAIFPGSASFNVDPIPVDGGVVPTEGSPREAALYPAIQ
ncbi:MAG: aryl-sulfate sulfotransferase [Deltaproteobacteria bacterium]|jgi:hypothetical protein|nr:aryl-sulfate sulfotransferase [Deltaproteobacteria bacterium]